MKRMLVVLITVAACSVVADTVAVAFPGPIGPLTRTPIRHVVVIFQENVSFDHYFGTYPNAANTDGQPFHAAFSTPPVDGLPPATSPSLPPRCSTARIC
jgi:phospholipase C